MEGRVFLIAALACGAAVAQDEVRVTSPNGQVELRLGVATPNVPGALDGLAYQVHYRGKPLVETSYLGFAIYHQAPLLGERVGLVASERSAGADYNEVTAEYLQNGVMGRRLTLEARAYDDGIAFRYLVPRSGQLEELLVENEITEFRFGEGVDVSGIAAGSQVRVPFAAPAGSAGWAGIAQDRPAPGMSVARHEGRILVTRLDPLPDHPLLAIQTRTPWTSPWRVLTIAATREGALNSRIVKSLER